MAKVKRKPKPTEWAGFPGFGLAVKEAREACGLTQQQLANKLGWSLSKVGHVESDSQNLHLSFAVELATGLGVTLDGLVKRAKELAQEDRERHASR